MKSNINYSEKMKWMGHPYQSIVSFIEVGLSRGNSINNSVIELEKSIEKSDNKVAERRVGVIRKFLVDKGYEGHECIASIGILEELKEFLHELDN